VFSFSLCCEVPWVEHTFQRVATYVSPTSVALLFWDEGTVFFCCLIVCVSLIKLVNFLVACHENRCVGDRQTYFILNFTYLHRTPVSCSGGPCFGYLQRTTYADWVFQQYSLIIRTICLCRFLKHATTTCSVSFANHLLQSSLATQSIHFD
jgi:hypothetical protein